MGALAITIVIITALILAVIFWSLNRTSLPGPALSVGGGSPLPTATPQPTATLVPTATPQPTATPGAGGGFTKNQSIPLLAAETPTSAGVHGFPNVQIDDTSSSFNIANDTYYQPFYVSEAITVNRVSVEYVTGNGATDCRVGIYDASNFWQPSTLEVDFGTYEIGTGDVAGWYHLTGLSHSLPSGSYLFAILCPSVQWGEFNGLSDITKVCEDITAFAACRVTMRVDSPSNTPTTAFPATGDLWDNSQLSGSDAGYKYYSLMRWTVN